MSYTYDAFDRRVSKKVDSDGNGTIDSQEYYVIDETSTSDLESVLVTIDGTGSVTHTYLHGDQVDQIFADENALGQVLWPLMDSQGTVREVATMSTANVLPSIAWNLRYGAFGDITSITDANGVAPAVNPVRYTYTGREWDVDADLYYYRARWYDAKAGRFISEDPKGFAAGDANLNRYVKNSSPNAVDPCLKQNEYACLRARGADLTHNGIKYDIMSGTLYSMNLHAKRMSDELYRMIVW